MPHILRRLGGVWELMRKVLGYMLSTNRPNANQLAVMCLEAKVPDIRSLHLSLLNTHFLMSTLSWPRFFFLLSVQLLINSPIHPNAQTCGLLVLTITSNTRAKSGMDTPCKFGPQ